MFFSAVKAMSLTDASTPLAIMYLLISYSNPFCMAVNSSSVPMVYLELASSTGCVVSPGKGYRSPPPPPCQEKIPFEPMDQGRG